MMDETDPSADGRTRWTTADDGLHTPATAHHDWTETTWWSFAVPERTLFGWLYCQMRPNNGTVAGGAFVYDDSGTVPWELPYYAYSQYSRLPETFDLRDVAFSNGVSVRCIEPGMRYSLGYQFRDHTDFTADLEFRGLTMPVPHTTGEPPFTGSSHYDQMGTVRGTLHLHGEAITVDCISMRDRSWGRRPELIGRRPGDRISYCYGATSESEAFLAFCAPPATEPMSSSEHLTSGWLLRDGRLRRLKEARREVARQPSGAVDKISLWAVDTDHRELHAEAVAVSTMFHQTSGLCVNSALRWDVDGQAGHGEDQDVWSTARFSAGRRA